MTVDQFAFNMMTGATVDAAADQPYLRTIAESSSLSSDDLRREIFAFRVQSLDLCVYGALKDSALFESITHSRWVLMEHLASEGHSPLARDVSESEVAMYAILLMRQMRILELCRDEAPDLERRLRTEGVARFGASILTQRESQYREALSGGLLGMKALFAELCGAPRAVGPLRVARDIYSHYRTTIRRELKSFRIVDRPE